MDSERRVVLDDTFGAAYIGAMFMMLLYGITTLQTYMYYIRYPKDTKIVKYMVLTLWLLDSAHVALVMHAMYYYLITNYSNPTGLQEGTRTLYASVGINVTIAFIVQCYFTQRLHILSHKNWWMTSIIGFFVIAHLCFGMETMIELFIRKRLDRLSEITFSAALPFAITAVLSDILIAGALCVLLWKNKTTYRSTNMVLNYLIVYAVNRCLLTSIVAIVEVVTFAIMPHSFWFLGIDFVIGKLWANSLLATLNSRKYVREHALDTELEDATGQSTNRAGISFDFGPTSHEFTSRARRSRIHNPVSINFTHSKSTATTELETKPDDSRGSVVEVHINEDRQTS